MVEIEGWQEVVQPTKQKTFSVKISISNTHQPNTITHFLGMLLNITPSYLTALLIHLYVCLTTIGMKTRITGSIN